MRKNLRTLGPSYTASLAVYLGVMPENKMKYYLLPILLMLHSCSFVRTDVMKVTKVIESPVSFKQRVSDIYEIANKCWPSPAYPFYLGTKVEKEIIPGEAVILARWVPLIGSETDPIIKIIVKQNGNGTIIKIVEREHPFYTKADYKSDAIRWLSGNYKC